MGVHAARNFDALHLRTVLGVTENLLGRDHARLQNALVVVDVGDKCIQRSDALFQTGLEPRPFIGGENTGHNVERNEPLGAGILAVDGERNADTMKQCIGLSAFLRKQLSRLLFEPAPIMLAVHARRACCIQHLVIRAGHARFPLRVENSDSV